MNSTVDTGFFRARPAVIPVRARTGPTTQTYSMPSTDVGCVFASAAAVTGGTVLVPDWPERQPTSAAVFLDIVTDMGAYVVRAPDGLSVTTRAISGDLRGVVASVAEASEVLPLLLVLAALADSESTFVGVSASADGGVLGVLAAAGAGIDVEGSRVTVTPMPLVGVRWSGTTDVATMAGLVLGLVVDGVTVDVGRLNSRNPGLLSEWVRIQHADEYLLPGSALLPHDYLTGPPRAGRTREERSNR